MCCQLPYQRGWYNIIHQLSSRPEPLACTINSVNLSIIDFLNITWNLSTDLFAKIARFYQIKKKFFFCEQMSCHFLCSTSPISSRVHHPYLKELTTSARALTNKREQWAKNIFFKMSINYLDLVNQKSIIYALHKIWLCIYHIGARDWNRRLFRGECMTMDLLLQHTAIEIQQWSKCCSWQNKMIQLQKEWMRLYNTQPYLQFIQHKIVIEIVTCAECSVGRL